MAIYAPSTLAPYVSLPSKVGGSTGYYSPTVVSGTSTWVETAIAGCESCTNLGSAGRLSIQCPHLPTSSFLA